MPNILKYATDPQLWGPVWQAEQEQLAHQRALAALGLGLSSARLHQSIQDLPRELAAHELNSIQDPRAQAERALSREFSPSSADYNGPSVGPLDPNSGVSGATMLERGLAGGTLAAAAIPALAYTDLPFTILKNLVQGGGASGAIGGAGLGAALNLDDPLPHAAEWAAYGLSPVLAQMLSSNEAQAQKYAGGGSVINALKEILRPSALTSHVVKPEGGQWLSGSVDKALQPLMRLPQPNPAMQPEAQAQTQALNSWISGPLRKYILNRMASPSDEIRQLADQGITHLPPDANVGAAPWAGRFTGVEGLPTQSAATPLGSRWEDIADNGIGIQRAAKYQASRFPDNPPQDDAWLAKLDPHTPIYSHSSDVRNTDNLGFDHLTDVLSNAMQAGELRPEQLNKVSVADAVRRAHEYNAQQAAKMAEAQATATEGMPIHKDYGDGMKWVELQHPTDDDATEAALQGEGDAMGHCVGGYCDDVLSGRSRIFSLRDEKGQPHVTIETQPQPGSLLDWFFDQPKVIQNEIYNSVSAAPTVTEMSKAIMQHPVWETQTRLPDSIVQIKGKQNAAPIEKYLPYVQDFVKSGQWSDVGDLQNTGLQNRSGRVLPLDWGTGKAEIIEPTGYVTPAELRAHIEAQKPEGVDPDFWNGVLRGQTTPGNYAAGGSVGHSAEYLRHNRAIAAPTGI